MAVSGMPRKILMFYACSQSTVSPWIVSQWPPASIICAGAAGGPDQAGAGWELSSTQTGPSTTTTTTTSEQLTSTTIRPGLCKECLTGGMSWQREVIQISQDVPPSDGEQTAYIWSRYWPDLANDNLETPHTETRILVPSDQSVV